MKHTRFVTSLVFFLTMAFYSTAQTAEKITGTFAATETCKINYTISPQPLGDNMALELYVSQPCMLNVHIVNTQGKELIPVSSGAVSRRVGKDVDISALSPGDYYVEIIYGENQQSHRVQFTKS